MVDRQQMDIKGYTYIAGSILWGRKGYPNSFHFHSSKTVVNWEFHSPCGNKDKGGEGDGNEFAIFLVSCTSLYAQTKSLFFAHFV